MRPRVREMLVALSKRDVEFNTETTKSLISWLKWCLISKKPVEIPGTFLTILCWVKRFSSSRDVISSSIGLKQANKLGCTFTMSRCWNSRWLVEDSLEDLRWWLVFTSSCLKTRVQDMHKWTNIKITLWLLHDCACIAFSDIAQHLVLPVVSQKSFSNEYHQTISMWRLFAQLAILRGQQLHWVLKEFSDLSSYWLCENVLKHERVSWKSSYPTKTCSLWILLARLTLVCVFRPKNQLLRACSLFCCGWEGPLKLHYRNVCVR